MKLFIFISMFITAVAFMNCTPNANFQNEDARFKSLMDGETVEVVDEQTFEDLNGESDTGIGGEGTSEEDNGSNMGEGEEDGGSARENRDGNGKRRGHSSEGKKNRGERSCRNRMLEQDRKGKRGDMITTPDEMENDKEMNDAVKCGENGKKVLVCHHPNSEYDKRKTLCVGAPALKAFISHMKASDVNYAGPCKDTEGNEADSHDERKGEKEGDE